MVDRLLRILIADPRHSALLQMEKTLNHLGYYRIAPVRSFEEVVTLSRYASVPIDVLITNADLGIGQGVDMVEFCREATQIRHSIVYENPATSIAHIDHGTCQPLRTQASLLSDLDVMNALLRRISALPTHDARTRQEHSERIAMN